MKKVSIVVLDRERNAALECIRDLGVLHVEQTAVSSAPLAEAFERKARIDSALGSLENFAPAKKQKKKDFVAENTVKDDSDDFVERVEVLVERYNTLQDWIYTNNRELRLYDDWGDFEPSGFKDLSDAGIVLIPYVMSPEAFSEIPASSEFVVLKADKKAIHLVAVKDPIPGFKPSALPKHSAEQLRKMNELKVSQMAEIEAGLADLSSQKQYLVAEQKEISAKIELETHSAGMKKVSFDGDSDKAQALVDFSIAYISGYVPASEVGKVQKAAADNNWAIISDDPALDDENVPTQLKNNKIASLIYPLLGFLDMMPGYHEVDISGWFMLFFAIYFGMLFGDAAYGLLLFAAAAIGIFANLKKGVPAIFKMLLMLSVSNIVWGVLTCSWFAIPDDKLPQVLKDMSFGLISTAKGADPIDVKNHLITFCFCLALLQLSIAHIKGIIKYIKSLRVFGEVASLLMLFGMWDLVLWLVVDAKYEVFHQINGEWGIMQAVTILVCGVGLNFIFGRYDPNTANSIIGRIGNGILESLKNFISVVLGISNVFSDIMSYIRLWAVGLAGASIAHTVNTMAGGMLGNTAGPIVAQLLLFAGIVLLCFGHSFNMVLNVLAVLVHGVRLNTLEFSGHLGLTWSGFAYKPFAKR
jgi:V/A-type H+-transporting ATPase subunit I